MQFDVEHLSAEIRYELLLSTVAPRPIALVTTLSEDGCLNAAPYSLFNVLCHDPPIVAIGVLSHPSGRLKDTGLNILERGEFVVNLVSEQLAEAMNLTCIDAPASVNELELAGLETAESTKVSPPRICGSPASFECRLETSWALGTNQTIVLGRIVHAHLADDFVLDATRGVIDTPALKLIGAMHGARWYARTSDLFAMDRPTWAQWKSDDKPP
jgi:flavin reductase (DIM6/NTAB) family NADH-FMN oxidoreductase RutF